MSELTQHREYNSQDFHLIEGKQGEFTLWRDNEKIYDKGDNDFPSGNDIIHLLRETNVHEVG